MLFAGFVVEQGALLQGVADDVVGDLSSTLGLRESSSDFENVVGAAGVSAGVGSNFAQDILVRFEVRVAEAA